MTQKVFKIPDGKGGVTFQVQTPDGRWHITDENGNLLPEEEQNKSSAPETPPVMTGREKRHTRKKPARSLQELSFVHFSMNIPKEDYKEFSDYVHWRSIFKGACTRYQVLLDAVQEVIRKDKEYKEFLKKNTPI